jgi:hypothetical protein
MPTSAEPPRLTDLQELSARLVPGALLFCLADPAESREWRRSAPAEGLGWLGWGQREALLREERPSAQERYSSQGGRHAPSLAAGWFRLSNGGARARTASIIPSWTSSIWNRWSGFAAWRPWPNGR